MFGLFSILDNSGSSYSWLKACLFIKAGFLLFCLDGSQSISQSISISEFTGTVPFACSFSGGGELVEMEYSRTGNTGSLLGTSDVLNITTNKVPRVNVSLNTINPPRPIAFRYVGLRADSTNILFKNATSSSLSNNPITTVVQPSQLLGQGYAAGSPFGIKLIVSATLSNSFPNELYQFQVVLDCLDPS
ncbi:hypothetical protein SynSYN20_03291 [Synechococcus sp. SYN20]|uniref:hypothetical protein n=1 Tax=Synechococcus sp. SYN20 TaxID=1050714 RepID=UPI0016468704|nr:hypothetical protein [Synechococcus sp. SYN20]QNJ27582.1 hypothetical protein SynSYN20_03291 [Synechococcus sp. SYN20]